MIPAECKPCENHTFGSTGPICKVFTKWLAWGSPCPVRKEREVKERG